MSSVKTRVGQSSNMTGVLIKKQQKNKCLDTGMDTQGKHHKPKVHQKAGARPGADPSLAPSLGALTLLKLLRFWAKGNVSL